MFNKGLFYRHERMRSTKILVLRVQYEGPEYLKVRVEWWINRKESYPIFGPVTIKIMRKDLKHWEIV